MNNVKARFEEIFNCKFEDESSEPLEKFCTVEARCPLYRYAMGACNIEEADDLANRYRKEYPNCQIIVTPI